MLPHLVMIEKRGRTETKGIGDNRQGDSIFV